MLSLTAAIALADGSVAVTDAPAVVRVGSVTLELVADVKIAFGLVELTGTVFTGPPQAATTEAAANAAIRSIGLLTCKRKTEIVSKRPHHGITTHRPRRPKISCVREQAPSCCLTSIV
jgi:hypothetical protein